MREEIHDRLDASTRSAIAALPYFECAGRHESFTRAARELCLSSTAVAHRIKTLEVSLGFRLFDRHSQGVTLTRKGRAYLAEVQETLAELKRTIGRYRSGGETGALKLVAGHAIAERWLMPKLLDFTAVQPKVRFTLEIDDGAVEPGRREFDFWFAFTDEVGDGPIAETLFGESVTPVCSPRFLAERGRPSDPKELRAFPLLYDFAWKRYWALWFECQGLPAPSLGGASGFGRYTLAVAAAVGGMGIALGHSRMIAPELERGTLVEVFKSAVPVPERYVLAIAPGARHRAEVHGYSAIGF